MSYVSTAYLPRCFRMYEVCVTYVRRIGPATYVLRIFKSTPKRSSSVYEGYELRIDMYELRMPMYVRRRLGDEHFVSCYAVDTSVDTQ